MNTKVLRELSYGMYIVGTLDQGRPTGCVANSAMQITSSPVSVAISINHDNYTNDCIQKSGKFTLSVLGQKTKPEIIGKFGYQSGRDNNKFEDISYEMKLGLPIVKDACGYMIFEVVDKMETSTHTVFLGNCIDGDVLENDIPMTYSYFHEVIKGSSPKNAPTYLAEDFK